jgi:membrane glycosyltransferase
LLREGPSASLRDKKSLLWDADSMLNLHRRLWSSPAAQWHGWWRESFQNYLA